METNVVDPKGSCWGIDDGGHPRRHRGDRRRRQHDALQVALDRVAEYFRVKLGPVDVPRPPVGVVNKRGGPQGILLDCDRINCLSFLKFSRLGRVMWIIGL